MEAPETVCVIVEVSEGVAALLPLAVGVDVATCVRVAEPDAVNVPVIEVAWLPVGVGDGVAAPLGVTLAVTLAVGDSVKAVENDCEGDCVTVALCVWDRLGVTTWVGVDVSVELTVCDPVEAPEAV